MGKGLADGITQGSAGPDEFRTAPLWGVGQRVFFLHDGRTSDLVEAIHDHQKPRQRSQPQSSSTSTISPPRSSRTSSTSSAPSDPARAHSCSCTTSTSVGCFRSTGVSHWNSIVAASAPANYATINPAVLPGCMPANVFVTHRARVTLPIPALRHPPGRAPAHPSVTNPPRYSIC